MFRVLYSKELMAASRNMKTPVFVFLLNAILAFLAIFSYYLDFMSQSKLGQTAKGIQILKIYTFLCLVIFTIVIITMLVLTIHCVLDERRNHSLDLIMAAGVSPWNYILSKLIARVVIVMLVALSSAPILGIVFFVGGVSVANLVTMYLTLFVTAFFVGSIGIFCSTYCKGSVTSTICAFFIISFFIVGTLMIVSMGYLYKKAGMGFTIDDMSTQIPIGKIIYVLLLNPLYTLLQLFRKQLGTMNELLQYIKEYNENVVIFRYWIVNSCIVQFIVSAIFIWLSVIHIKHRKNSKRAVFK